MRQGSVGLWHGAGSGGVEALGLGWLHAGMGWEASSGSEGAGEAPSGLHGGVKAQRVMEESWSIKKKQNLLVSAGQWHQCTNKLGH